MRLQAKFWPNVYYKAKIICFDPAPLLSIRIICSCLIIILGCFKTPQLQKTLWLAGHPLVCSDPLRNVEPITQTVWDTFRKTGRAWAVHSDCARTNAFYSSVCMYVLGACAALLFTFTMAMMIKPRISQNQKSFPLPYYVYQVIPISSGPRVLHSQLFPHT